MENEDKVIIKLKKQPLESERREIRARKKRTVITVLICILFLVIGLFGGYYIAGISNSFLYKDEHSKFDKIIELMKNNWLYAKDYDDVEKMLEDQAYYGMLTFEDDPYTVYMSSEDLNEFQTNINQDYVGIGVMYSSYGDIPEITRVYNNTPAQEAGIRVGDVILKVDGIEIDETNINDIKSYVTGEEGTIVNIVVLRDAKEVSIDVKRGAVGTSVYAYDTEDYGYLEIASFGESTADEVEKYLNSIDNKNLIIDLRDDTGGYQSAVEEISGFFIGPEKIYMKQQYADGQMREDLTPKDVNEYKFDKIVVLTNANTASAAEVLTICLREYLDNVIVVGETTYGKGVVQATAMIEEDSAVKYTTSKWLSPITETWINGEGIHPDVEIMKDDVLYQQDVNMDEEKVYKVDDCSEQIMIAEMCLKYLDYEIDRTDGYFSEKAINAVVEFKKDHDINPTEEMDYKTYRAIISATSYENSTNLEKDTQLQKAIEILNG